MNHRDYVAQREARDPEFKATREALRPEYERRKVEIGRQIAQRKRRRDIALWVVVGVLIGLVLGFGLAGCHLWTLMRLLW